MKIKSIKLHNIRSHKDNVINFNDGITIISGRTGSGKSSILMAIEYALFGNTPNVSNSSLMRRDENEASVELTFEHANSTYVIKRGLKRNKRGISVDISNLNISKDGTQIGILSRVNDLNETIRRVLGYPENVDSLGLFEITTYTRQDEIRKLISLSSEKRQEYIDNILQLSKYKRLWQYLGEIITYFTYNLNELKIKIDGLNELEKEIENLRKSINEKEKELSLLISDQEKLTKGLEELTFKIKEYENYEIKYDNVKSKYKSVEGSYLTLLKTKDLISNEITNLKLRLRNLSIENDSSGDLNELYSKRGNIQANINLLEKEIRELTKQIKEFEDSFSKSKDLVCPLCKQKLTYEHLNNLREDYNLKLKEYKLNLDNLTNKLSNLNILIKKSEKNKKILEDIQKLNDLIKDKEKQITKIINELENYKKDMEELNKEISNLKFYKEEIDKLKKKESEVKVNLSSVSTKIKVIQENISESKNILSEKESKLNTLNVEKDKIEKLESLISLLSRLRENVRNIREVVRERFLEDFRFQFAKKFEEIRERSEYSVDILPNYEPIAYSGNLETPINQLSGGEKTSVALAYRLALADIAAKMGGVNPSELLILDEPTVGFDREDIKILPDVLRNIKSIPQIIIISHQPELKNAADFKYELEKVNGETIIKNGN